MLESFGLDHQVESVYRLMLAEPSWGMERIAAHLGLSMPELRSALDRLAELTLLRPSLDAPDLLYPVSPEVGFHALLQRQQTELAQKYEQFVENQAAISTLMDDYLKLKPQDAREGAERLEGSNIVQDRLEKIVQRTANEFLAFVPGGPQRPANLAASRPLDQTLRDRNVEMRSIYLDSLQNDPATLAHANWLTSIGVQLRTSPTLPMRMLLADRAVALIPIDPDNSALGAVQITEASVVIALVALFEQVWAISQPFGEQPEPEDEEGLSAQERALLRLLSQGFTDEGAARRLGVSLRTVRRMVSVLMTRLGARSRFEAGLLAADRNWISPARDATEQQDPP